MSPRSLLTSGHAIRWWLVVHDARQVESLEEVEELVVLGGRNRTVGNNNVNEHSSRSHLVLQVHITSTNMATGYVQHGKLNLIDLAGSERIKVRPVLENVPLLYCLFAQETLHVSARGVLLFTRR